MQPDEHSDPHDRTHAASPRGRGESNAARDGHRPQWGGDAFRVPWALIAVPVAFVQLFGTRGAAHAQPDARDLGWFGWLLVLAGPVALLAAARYPRTVVGVTITAAAAYYTFGYPPGPVFAAVIVAMFLWGRGMRRARIEAQRRAGEAEDARRAGAERLRIAQELHDVLAHHISLINVQAGVALHLVDERPEQTRESLAAIKLASKEALGQLRSALDALRNPGDTAPRAPAAGLAELPAIVDSVRAAGLDVRLDITGERRAVGTATELAALRIVQEALTNVLRHASASAAEVTVAYGEDAVTVEVADDGRGGVPVPGNGLGGMRERAEALGGSCTAGPAPGGGFAVRATLPG